MHLGVYWTACLFISESLISARGQSELSDSLTDSFICTTVLKKHFLFTYPEWQIAGSYQDLAYAYDQAAGILDKMKSRWSSVSAESDQPSVMTWEDWLKSHSAKGSVNLDDKEALSTATQPEEAIVLILVLNRDDFKHFFDSVHDTRLPNIIALVVQKSNNKFPAQSDGLDVRFFKESLNNDLRAPFDDILDKDISETESRPDYLESLSNMMEAPAQEMAQKNEGLDADAILSGNTLWSENDSKINERHFMRQNNPLRAPGRVSNQFDVFSRQKHDFDDNLKINQQSRNEIQSDVGLLSILKQSAKKFDGQESDYGEIHKTCRKTDETSAELSRGDEVDSEWTGILNLYDKNRKGSARLLKLKGYGHEPELEMREEDVQDDPEEIMLLRTPAVSDSMSNSLGRNSVEKQVRSDGCIRREMKNDFEELDEKLQPLLQSKNDEKSYFEANSLEMNLPERQAQDDDYIHGKVENKLEESSEKSSHLLSSKDDKDSYLEANSLDVNSAERQVEDSPDVDYIHREKSLPLLSTTNDKDDKDSYYQKNVERFLATLQVDEAKQKEIEENTKQQADCKRWHLERKYRLTASCFGIVWNWTESKERLVYRLLYSSPRNSTDKKAALDWGRDHEKKAAFAYGQLHNVSVEPAGLIVDLKRGYLAASPDGYIGNDTLVEIKCPYFLRHTVPMSLVKTDELYCCDYDFDEGKVRLKRHHYYYYQLQGQMGISGRKKGIFILWSPRGILSEKIDFDPELWEKMVKVLEEFYKDYLVPEYIYNYHRYEHQYDEDS